MTIDQALRVATLLLLTLLSPGLLAAQLRIVLFDVAPFSYQDGAGQLTGLHVAKAQELARRAGYQAHIELMPFARIGLLLESGAADMTIGFETDRLRQAAFRLGPIMRGNSILLARQPLAAIQAQALQGLRLGRLRGGCFELQPYREQLQSLYELNNYASGLSMLQSGRLDAICGTEAAIGYAAEQAGLHMADYHSISLTQGREFWVFVSRRAAPALRQAIERALREMGSGAAPL